MLGNDANDQNAYIYNDRERILDLCLRSANVLHAEMNELTESRLCILKLNTDLYSPF